MPLDAASESLASALRASFRILKFIMFVLVVLYCFSGVQCIDENEQAVVVRFGKLLPEVRSSGLSLAFPYPIDETIVVPTRQDNRILVKHWPLLRPNEETQPLENVRGGGGLNPANDGALLTADKGMVHMQWSLLYRITDLQNYVRYVSDSKSEKLDDLIASVLDNVAIHIVSEYTAEAATRGKTAEIAERVKAAINEELETLQTGVTIVGLDVPKSSVPGQTIIAFNQVTQAEAEKNKLIRSAEQKATDILNKAAGAQHEELLRRIDAFNLLVAQNKSAEAAQAWQELDAMLEDEVGGDAGRRVREARSYYTNVVQQVRGDVEQYQAALSEYLAAPQLFIERMWEDTRARLMQNDGVKKHFVMPLADELRIKIGEDPEQRRIDEERKLRQDQEQQDFSTPGGFHRVMPPL